MERSCSPITQRILSEPKPLSDPQQKAILCERNHIRIIAGAGAGKTETLTRRIVYLLLEKQVEPSAIVAFTFTEKAAESMKSRIYERVKHLGGEEICARLGDMYVGTIHGYCSKILEEHFGYGGYGVLDERQEMAFLMRVGWSLSLGKNGFYSTNCEAFLNTLSVVYGEMLPQSRLESSAPDFYRMFRSYEQLLDDHKRLTFDRMISVSVEKLAENPEVLNRVTHLIVDEYQDINRAQERLIQLIGKGALIFIVGDPRQTIYQWRGSDKQCFDDFKQNYTDCATILITENHRSTRQVIDLANSFSDTFRSDEEIHMNKVREEEGATYGIVLENDTAEAVWICDQIERYVNGGICSFKDIALLFRSVTTSAPPFIDEMRRRGIPCIVGGKVGLFRRPEIRSLGQIFCWLAEDGFWQENRWDWKNRITGDGILSTAIRNWQEGFPAGIEDAETLERSIRFWKESVLRDGYENFTEAYYQLLTTLGYHFLDPADPVHAAVMANVGSFGNILTDFETANRLGGRGADWPRDLKNLCWYINMFASSKYEEHPGDEMGVVNAVNVFTIHQSKGLEWPLVFIPSMVTRRFPSSMVGRQRDWFIPRNLFDVMKYEGDLESERKLLYVALTRAKDVVVVSRFTSVGGQNRGSSEFMDDLDELNLQEWDPATPLPLYPLRVSEASDELRTYAATEIVDYGKCPYFYRLRHLWGYQPGLSKYLGYGSTLHFCMRTAAELMREEGYSARSAVSTAISRNFYMPFMPPKRMAEIQKNAKRNLIRFVHVFEEDMHRIREVEARIEFPLQNAIVAGKIDVILCDGEGVEIRDYKATDAATTTEEVATQIQLYVHGLSKLGETVCKGSVGFLEEALVDAVDVGQETIAETVRRTEKRINDIESGRFTPCPGQFCERCDYSIICRWKP